MHLHFKKIAALVCLINLSGCQTSRIRAFSQVKEGQTKTTVLESLGGPDRRIREEGKDRWIYVLYGKDVDNPDWKEIQFINNKVTYIGDRTKAEKTADQVDEKNEKSNRQEEDRLNELQHTNDKRLGRINSPAYEPDKTMADEPEVNPTAEKYKKAPTFVPIQ